MLRLLHEVYKLAEEVKKSPKGYMTTIERVGKAVKGPKLITTSDVAEVGATPTVESSEPLSKSKKKSLDELLEQGMV